MVCFTSYCCFKDFENNLRMNENMAYFGVIFEEREREREREREK
jgi:hypothetical protein